MIRAQRRIGCRLSRLFCAGGREEKEVRVMEGVARRDAALAAMASARKEA